MDILPDVALLEIFDFYVDEAWVEAWYTLVHVCRKWRNVVFGSPRRLHLRLHCTARTPVREMLDVWPLLPIVIRASGREMYGDDNIIAALEHTDRVCGIGIFGVSSSRLETLLAAMRRPFPALAGLRLRSDSEAAPAVIPASFLGGSAPRLQILILDRIPFPGLSKLLSSATHLVDLSLWRIPHSGYIPPESMAACLSVLTRLESLVIRFESPLSRPVRKGRLPPPPTRTLLPVLIELQFFGVSEYLEVLVARIEAPILDKLDITFFQQLIFDTPQLTQFISHTPKFKTQDKARVVFSTSDVSVRLPQTFDGLLELAISCRQSDWQLSSLAQICNASFPHALFSLVDQLYIVEDASPRLRWQDDIESSQWLELLHPFSSVTGLYISQEFAPRIGPVLQELAGEGVTEVLPALRTLFLEDLPPSGPVLETIGQFVAARKLAGHPVSVSPWERK